MNDVISRQAAIEETWKEPSYADPLNVLTEMRDRLRALPSAQQWTPCCKGMPDEQYSDTIGDFKYILCTTIWGDVRPYKYGTPIGGDAPHFWHGPQAMDEKVVAWAYMPAPYTEGENG